MTDIFDRASDMEQVQRDAALNKHRQRMAAQSSIPSAEHCGVCGECIPEGRRQAVPGCQTCVRCQEELDMATKGY